MWLKLFLKAVSGWVPWSEDWEKTCESWSGCWHIREFPRDKEGEKCSSELERVRTWEKLQWASDCVKEGLFAGQGAVSEWSAWPQRKREMACPSSSLQHPISPRLRKPQGMEALYCQNILLWETETNVPWAVLNNFPAHMETTSSVKNSDKGSWLCFNK